MNGHDQRMLIRADRVIGRGDASPHMNAVLIKGGLIEDILSEDSVPAHTKIYDFPGHVIAPFFCDYHLHFSSSAGLSTAGIADRLLAHGINKAFEGGDAIGAGLTAKKNLADRLEILSSGFGIYREGGYGKSIGRGVKDIEQAKSEIEALISAGADYVKVVHSGIYDPEDDRITAGGFERRELGEIIAYVRDRGLPVFCHANGTEAVQEAVDLGASAIIHGLQVSEETLSLIADKRVMFIPTLQAFQSLRSRAASDVSLRNLEEAVEGHMAAVGRAHAMGVKVMPGSDAGPPFIPYGSFFCDELWLLMKAGIPFEDVLRNASARAIKRDQQADLLILEGFEIRHVVRRGEFLQ